MPRERALTVLHSTRASAPGETKYADHMAAVASDEIHVVFFTWRHALFGRYDLFHLHWPEGLAGGAGARGIVKSLLTLLLVLRLRLTRTPVVSTLHNHAPHDARVSWRLRRITRAFERMTRVEIHLVPEPDRVAPAPVADIPHGSYVQPFAGIPRAERVNGRVLFFGLIRPYKGIDALLDRYAEADMPGALRIVGNPIDDALAGRVDEAAQHDARITRRFGFLRDADLVDEVTSAQLIVLPYREMHSSGAVLVALSLGRPVLVPDGSTARALREEIGDGWVHTFSGDLTANDLRTAFERSRELPSDPPDLSARSWDRVGAAHAAAYRTAVGRDADETVFAWLWGQDDNVGDTALRREYADALRARGPLVAYVDDASDDFVAALGLADGDRVTSSLTAWLRDAVSAARRGPATLAINAGEFSFSGGYTVRLLRILPALRRFHRRGGAIVWLGAAVPSPRRGVTWLFRRLFRMADLVRWRDDETARVFEPAPSMPDWALGLPTSGVAVSQSTLGVSLRADRPYPSPAWIRAVRETADRLGLEIVTFAQVRRDSARARQLAADLGARAVPFDDATTHLAQEGTLRREYAGMRAVLSDRLHVLLLAFTEGVVPLAWVEAATPKLSRHLDALGLPWATVQAGELPVRIAELDDDTLLACASDSAAAYARAVDELADVRRELVGDQWRPAARANTRS
ncbi:polysaccharide pyruvyl transferase family protein [Microbacterium suaedae]|uniref:polysaccharide pyruvyl transferase family protein n=1 Tax=Microbacterium suaedae TaxID=2067813 RepID=UPI000DA26673|nr:polysaccharide pyruvyl transferase family protein [Microbacterium suaedae]